MTDLVLPADDGRLERVPAGPAPVRERPVTPLSSRVAYAAAHVVPRAWADTVPGAPADLDWDATLGFRRHVWSWGLGVADAMDTAQRNMGLDWPATRELIRRSAHEARAVGGALVVGVTTDHLDDEPVPLDAVVDAYRMQLDWAQEQGAGVVLMASRHLALAAERPADYVDVYRRVIEHAASPVILHWLGEAFDARLRGYWGSTDVARAADTVVELMGEVGEAVAGIKMSLLDASAEVAVRRRLPASARMYTGDDFHYVSLIEGDEEGHSDALLGAFAAIAPTASAALQRLDAGDVAGYRALLGPTEELSRTIFEAPTSAYKTGVAFLSWLNGHQPTPLMVGGVHAARSLAHLARVVRLAAAAGALEDPDLAARRWNGLLALHGIEG